MATGSPKSSPYLIPVMVLFILAILFFVGMLINYISHPSTIPTITNIPSAITPTATTSPTPSTTSTITLTPRPTWTLRPSSTATQTPTATSTTTPTLIRTITPAKPANFNDRYELKPWDLGEQDRTIELLKANAILKPSDDAFRALAYAEAEAYLRFPQAFQSTSWRWDRAYNLVHINDPVGISLYSILIQSAIASGQVRSIDLPTWFSLYETRISLHISPLSPQPGELGRELIELVGDGSAFLWLVENPTGTSIYPLLNDINSAHPHKNTYLYDDLTGDSTPELVIYRRVTPGETQLVVPHIFDLSVTPPVELPIQDQALMDFGLEPQTKAAVVPNLQGDKILQVTYMLLPACPVYVTQDYSWNGNSFVATSLQYQVVPVNDLRAYCEVALDQASSGWGPEAAINIANPMLKIWPPETDTQGHPYPIDANDQLRYRLGVLYALAGQPSEAIRIISEIVDAPIVPDSAWVTPAKQFLHNYKTPDDLFTACQQAQFCNLRDALRTMVKNSATNDPGLALQYLQNHGVVTSSSGLLDFDGDGQVERWMIIRPKSDAKLEFWILSPMQTGVQAIFVQLFEAGELLPYFHEPAGSIPVIQFELQSGFVFKRLPGTQEAYIQWVDVEYARPTIIRDGFIQSLNSLFNGSDLVTVQKSLLELINSPRFIGDCIAFKICDQFHYILGLVYDLLGEQGNAIDQYLWVWRNYGQSPYATMARLKLNYFPLPTYTRTPIPTGTTVPTHTPTPTTQTPTMTNSPTRTLTPTYTLTPTSTFTPTQTETHTPSAAP
jgi:hypothetical protein